MVQGHLLLEEASARLQGLGEARGLLHILEQLCVQGDQAQGGVRVLGEEGHGHADPGLQHGLQGVALKWGFGRREIFLLSDGRYFCDLTESIFD